MTISGADSQAHQSHFNVAAHVLRGKPQQASQQLSPDEEKQVEQLKRRDAEVRQHEQAHKAAAGQYASGGPSYDSQTGPDGKQYAVGGEVQTAFHIRGALIVQDTRCRDGCAVWKRRI